MKKTNNFLKDNNNQLKDLLVITGIISAIFLVFFVITLFITKEEPLPETPTSIQYDEILASNMFSQSETSYYVIVFKEEDINNELYATYMNTYEGEENSLNVYSVNIDEKFNEFYLGDANVITSDLSQLKLNSPVLIKVENKQVVATYETKENITNHFKELLK